MLTDSLKELGFSDKEVKVYLCLAELGKANVHQISKRTGISRTTVYPVLSRLTEKGLISEEPRKGVAYFVAHPPENLWGLIHREEQELKARQKLISEVVNLVTPHFRSKNYSVPKLQFFEGDANIRSMLDSHLTPWFDSMRKYDNTLWGYQDHTFTEQYSDWLQRYWSNKDPSHQICLFSNKSRIEMKLKSIVENREIRALPKDYQLNSTVWISGDYITMIMTRQRPHYAFQILDPVFAANLKLFVKLLWDREI